MFSTLFSSGRRWSYQFSFALQEKGFSFMFSIPFFELNAMVVSVFFFSLQKRLQLRHFYPVFRAEDDGGINFIYFFLYEKSFSSMFSTPFFKLKKVVGVHSDLNGPFSRVLYYVQLAYFEGCRVYKT